MTSTLNEKAADAAKWSLLTEVLVKLVTPITQLILARILTPEAFGVVATVTMVTSFADMFSDSGFQKYLVQHEFSDKDDLYRNANVAFWTNMGVSILLWGLIAVFRDPLAEMVGNAGLGIVLVVACASLPMTSFSSIQLALFRRELNFKSLLPIRTFVALIPLVVTLPLALMGFDYWSLIIGTIAGNLFNAVALTAKSEWKPKLYYSMQLFREMFAFSGWSLLEAVAIWLTSWAGTFVIGGLLNSYYLGLYKQPMTFVNSAFALVTNATTPVLFSSLSKLQNDDLKFQNFFYKFQFSVGMFVLPLGVGIFFFRDFLTNLLLGDAWTEASLMLGSWGLSSGLTIVFGHYCSEVFRAKGKPKVSLLCQCLYMCYMVPALYVSASFGFSTLVVVNAVVRVLGIAIDQTALRRVAGIRFTAVVRGLKTPLFGSSVMGLVAYLTSSFALDSWALNFIAIAVCIAVYVIVCCGFSDGRIFLYRMIGSKIG